MLTPEEILAFTAHRPFPLPDTPWFMFQQWTDLLFAHWALEPAIVRPLVPEQLDLELFGGMAWIGLTPFRMTDIHLRGLPPLPGAGSFLEMNLRTYVRAPDPGIFFFSLDASNLAAVAGARIGFGLPYFWSDMSATIIGPEQIHYRSNRRQSTARVHVEYQAAGPVLPLRSGLEIFLTERYCLYEVRAGIPLRTDIHHLPWPLQTAEAQFLVNTIGPVHKLPPLSAKPDLLHFSKTIDVLVFPPSGAQAI